ncbi:MAG: sulfatase, partial [Verrucomicrobiota bacterium]
MAYRSLLLLIAFCGLHPLARAVDRPNVIILYTDDQGTLDARCYGASHLYTPNIDALAASGI